jgi:hypothetical protein
MESNIRSHTCRKRDKWGKPHKDFGKKTCIDEFNEWAICAIDTNSPKAELFANIITDYLTQEESDDHEQILPGSSKRERDTSDSRHQERLVKKVKKARFTAY